jgi:hypothetical protein
MFQEPGLFARSPSHYQNSLCFQYMWNQNSASSISGTRIMLPVFYTWNRSDRCSCWQLKTFQLIIEVFSTRTMLTGPTVLEQHSNAEEDAERGVESYTRKWLMFCWETCSHYVTKQCDVQRLTVLLEDLVISVVIIFILFYWTKKCGGLVIARIWATGPVSKWGKPTL